MKSPVEQFTIKTLVPLEAFGYDISFTNASLFMVLSVIISSLFLYLGIKKSSLIPNRFQSSVELLYEFVSNMVKENVGTGGKKYFPFIFSLFMFILFGNLLGMIPYSYTFTSQIIVTITLALIIFIGVTLIALIKHKLKFFTFFFITNFILYVPKFLINFFCFYFFNLSRN